MRKRQEARARRTASGSRSITRNSATVEVVYKGRPASIDPAKVRELQAAGMGASEIAKTLKIGLASVYRLLATQGGTRATAALRAVDRSSFCIYE